MENKWQLRPEIPERADEELQNYPKLVRKLLFYRGIETADQARSYLSPDYERDQHDPFLMKDMGKGVARFLQALEAGEKIVVWGDYDADGVPGVAILATFLNKIGYSNYEVYIPDRHNQAYGLNPDTINLFGQQDVKLIITIDCGITDISEVKLAQSFGIDVIITDHHLVRAEIPPAYAIINAKQSDDNYPYKLLAGAGVMFKFVSALLKEKDFGISPGWEKWLLDLVAIATISDMVSLTGENRLLALYGLKVLSQTKRLGLSTLFSRLKLKPAGISEDDIGFMIGPRINSASRMSHASQAYYLLMTTDPVEAETIVDHLEEKNKERKEMVESIVGEVARKINEQDLPPIIVAGSPTWSLGGLGLASSKLVDKYNRSVWLWGKNGQDIIKGSCRSNGSLNVVDVMRQVGEDFFLDFGGHPMAGGFSLSPERVEELAPKLIEAAQAGGFKEVEREIWADEELSLDQLNWETYRLIEAMAPFGMDNAKPVFCLRTATIWGVKYFGNGGLHLELVFQKSDGKKISAIGFFASPTPNDPTHIFGDIKLEQGERVDLLVTLEKSVFKNYPELRLRIVDLRKAR